mgnify:CR=1 FL=1
MTMMYARPAFAGAGVTELNVSEIDAVAGGPIPIGVAVVTAVLGAVGGCAAAKSTDDCRTRTTTTVRTMPDGSTRTHTVSETVCS